MRTLSVCAMRTPTNPLLVCVLRLPCIIMSSIRYKVRGAVKMVAALSDLDRLRYPSRARGLHMKWMNGVAGRRADQSAILVSYFEVLTRTHGFLL